MKRTKKINQSKRNITSKKLCMWQLFLSHWRWDRKPGWRIDNAVRPSTNSSRLCNMANNSIGVYKQKCRLAKYLFSSTVSQALLCLESSNDDAPAAPTSSFVSLLKSAARCCFFVRLFSPPPPPTLSREVCEPWSEQHSLKIFRTFLWLIPFGTLNHASIFERI